MRIIFHKEYIKFHSYPFFVASVRRHKKLHAKSISEIDPQAFPPQVITTTGEVIFVKADQRHDLISFALCNHIRQVIRVDVWGLLLAPYLDIRLDANNKQINLDALKKMGFKETEITGIRQRVGKKILKYNSILWEWESLGHIDLLYAYGFANWLKRPFLSPKKDYDDFNQIALRAAVSFN